MGAGRENNGNAWPGSHGMSQDKPEDVREFMVGASTSERRRVRRANKYVDDGVEKKSKCHS